MNTNAGNSNNNNSWKLRPPYNQEFGRLTTATTTETTSSTTVSPTFYTARCYCGRVQYEVRGEPEISKNCHCHGCQQLHGAPYEWVSIFHKHNVRFANQNSLEYLYFYSGELDIGWDSSTPGMAKDRILPCKVSCTHCRTPIADEGRNMWLAFTTLFGFTIESGIPPKFQYSCHLFYSQRCVNVDDRNNNSNNEIVKWEGQKGKSKIWQPPNTTGDR